MNPTKAADILIAAAPDLDADLVKKESRMVST